MIIIGERINSTRAKIKEAIGGRDLAFLVQEAQAQLACGADYIDINCATSMARETEDLRWLVVETQARLGCKISIDSPHPHAIKAALDVHQGKAFVNSITGERRKLEEMLSMIRNHNCCVIALAMDEKGVPEDTEQRVSLAKRIIELAGQSGAPKESIYVDPLVKPAGTEPKQAGCFLEAVKALKGMGILTIGGLSNVSYGLPARRLLNAAFLKLAVSSGLDAAIIDPTDALTKDVLAGRELPPEQYALASDVLLGKDEYSVNYIRAFRQGRLNVSGSGS